MKLALFCVLCIAIVSQSSTQQLGNLPTYGPGFGYFPPDLRPLVTFAAERLKSRNLPEDLQAKVDQTVVEANSGFDECAKLQVFWQVRRCNGKVFRTAYGKFRAIRTEATPRSTATTPTKDVTETQQ